MKKILFVHQNFPGQYRYLARYYAAHPDWQAYAIGEKENVKSQLAAVPKQGLQLMGYDKPPSAHPQTLGVAQDFEQQLYRAQTVANLALRQKAKGLDPDIICSHPGWGDSLYLKEIFPRAKLINYFEYYYRPEGDFMLYDPEYRDDIGGRMRFRAKNALNLLTLDMADRGVCPTQWQASTFPNEYRSKIEVIHDGIDTEIVAPKDGISITVEGLKQGALTFTESNEIITFSVRNLEPHRGFHIFMRALPELQKKRPKAITVIVGGDEVSYGIKHNSGKSWRQVMLDEVGGKLDESRVIFVGKLPYQTLLNLFRITSLHVYLTSPFVLSWSLLEAMGCGAPVLASSTPPVTEVIEDGLNGFLFDFYDIDGLVARASELLDQTKVLKKAGELARSTIVNRYDLKTVCLPKHIQLIDQLLAR